MNAIRLTCFAVLLTLAVAAHAANPVGAWTGHFVPKIPALPASAPAAMKAKLTRDLAQIKKGRLQLVVKADHTYTMHTVDLPMFGKPDSKGTWSQAGSTFSMTEAGSPKAQALQLDATGKRMSLVLGKSGSLVVFTR